MDIFLKFYLRDLQKSFPCLSISFEMELRKHAKLSSDLCNQEIEMDEFDALSETQDTLLGPGGCPWDRKQTLDSVRGDLLEEVYELLEAICENDNDHICEELGDVASCWLFMSKLAEKEGRCTLRGTLSGVREKLIRRHPHVFGTSQASSDEELKAQWDEIKRGERGMERRKSLLDGIPVTLPALARSQEIARKIRRSEISFETASLTSEERLGEQLWSLVEKANENGIDAEEALRKVLTRKERLFRTLEQTMDSSRSIENAC